MAQEYNNPKEKSAQQVQSFAPEQQAAPTQFPAPEPGTALMEEPLQILAPRAVTAQIQHGLFQAIPEQSASVPAHETMYGQEQETDEETDDEMEDEEGLQTQKRYLEDQDTQERKRQRTEVVQQQQVLRPTLAELLPEQVSSVLQQKTLCRIGWSDSFLNEPLIGEDGRSPFVWLNGDLLTNEEKIILLSRLGSVTPELKAEYEEIRLALKAVTDGWRKRVGIISTELDQKIILLQTKERAEQEVKQARFKQDIGFKDFKSILFSRYDFLKEKYGEKLDQLKQMSKLELFYHYPKILDDFKDAETDKKYLLVIPGLVDEKNEKDKRLIDFLGVLTDYVQTLRGGERMIVFKDMCDLYSSSEIYPHQWEALLACEPGSGINWATEYQKPEGLITQRQQGEPDYVLLARQAQDHDQAPQ